MSSARSPVTKPATSSHHGPEQEALVEELLKHFCEYARILSDKEKSIAKSYLASQTLDRLKYVHGLLNGKPQQDCLSADAAWIKQLSIGALASLFMDTDAHLEKTQGKKYCAFFFQAPLLPRIVKLVELHKGKTGAALALDAVLSIAGYFALKKTLGSAASAGVAGGTAVAGVFILMSVLLYQLRPSAYRIQIDHAIKQGRDDIDKRFAASHRT